MARHLRSTSWLLLLTAFFVVGCRKHQPDPMPAPAVQPAPDPAPNDSAARAEAARRDSLAREERMRAERAQRLEAARATLVRAIYFDYDRSTLSDESRRALEAKLSVLTNSPEVRLRITGHADERGSDEYNLALGQSRAAAALRYLVDHGIDRSRLDLTSYGEERPVCTDANEACWSRNRRAEFEIIAGAERIVAY